MLSEIWESLDVKKIPTFCNFEDSGKKIIIQTLKANNPFQKVSTNFIGKNKPYIKMQIFSNYILYYTILYFVF